jgi:hypothetical protein
MQNHVAEYDWFKSEAEKERLGKYKILKRESASQQFLPSINEQTPHKRLQSQIHVRPSPLTYRKVRKEELPPTEADLRSQKDL